MKLASARPPLPKTTKTMTLTTTTHFPSRRNTSVVVAFAARQRGPRTATAPPSPAGPSSPPPPSTSSSSSSVPSYRPGGPIRIIQVSPDASDAWRLAPVVECLRAGGVAVVPTDSVPALVVDSGCRDGPARLYKAKGSSKESRKPLSILVRGFSDIDAYTAGWPAATAPGSPALFRVARSALPGPYTLILQASNALPKHCVDADNPGKKKSRKAIGVRLSSHPVTRAILEELDRPLLAASVGSDNGSGGDAAEIADFLGGRGVVEFVVDCESGAVAGARRRKGGGEEAGSFSGGGGGGQEEGSTVIDLTVSPPRLVRWGRGDPSPFLGEEGMAEAEAERAG